MVCQGVNSLIDVSGAFTGNKQDIAVVDAKIRCRLCSKCKSSRSIVVDGSLKPLIHSLQQHNQTVKNHRIVRHKQQGCW